jgi:uncharacterized protein
MQDVIDNHEACRFEIVENGATAFADYAREDGVISIRYVFAPESLRGTGAAGRLMEGIVEQAKQNSEKIRPICGYAVSWLRRHKDHADLVV